MAWRPLAPRQTVLMTWARMVLVTEASHHLPLHAPLASSTAVVMLPTQPKTHRVRVPSVPPCHLDRNLCLSRALPKIMSRWRLGCWTDTARQHSTPVPTDRCLAWRAHPSRSTSTRKPHQGHATQQSPSLSTGRRKYRQTCSETKLWASSSVYRMVSRCHGATTWSSPANTTARLAERSTFRP